VADRRSHPHAEQGRALVGDAVALLGKLVPFTGDEGAVRIHRRASEKDT
jgi:hypothetical protein